MTADERPQPQHSDEELGMHRKISRRDFLDGVALAAAGVALGGTLGSAAAAAAPAGPASRGGRPYPPSLTGLRGSTDASLSVAHQLRDGTFWQTAPQPEDTGQEYDVVIVGGGLSGLTAAHQIRRENPKARILILENHDDFGGHARRNEFRFGGKRIIGYGGSQSIDSPSTWSKQSLQVLKQLGIRLKRFDRAYDDSLYADLGITGRGLFFDRETFGADHLTVRQPGMTWSQVLAGAPLAERAKQEIAMLYESPKDWLPGMSDEEKKQFLARITYEQYLTDVVGVHPDTIKYVHTLPSGNWAYHSDGIGALDAWGEPLPGFDGLGLDDSVPHPLLSVTTQRFWYAEDPYIYHFPDGNGGIARMLVRSLVPEAMDGHTMDSEVRSRMHYENLDRSRNQVRIRLNATVVRVRHLDRQRHHKGVEVAYAKGGRLQTVRAKGVVMACWHTMIPFVCDELPQAQSDALANAIKLPIIYTNVLVRNWKPFQRLQMSNIRYPGGYWLNAGLDFPVSMGGYQFPQSPDEPMLLHMTRVPTKSGMNPQQGSILGRVDMIRTSFETMERHIRDQLVRALGSGGFDPARDIEAITINRWAHGYAYEYALPWDSFYPDGEWPSRAASQPFGRITFANTDAGPRAYVDSAMDEGLRAAGELLARIS